MRVGDSVAIPRMLGTWAIDRGGADVRFFAPSFRVRASPAARFRQGHLVALAPGDAVIEVRGARVPMPAKPPERPLTLVPVRVIPR